MNIILRDLLGNNVLAGATAGAQGMAKLISTISNGTHRVVFLDFSGIEAATGSYLRECMLGFRSYCRRTQPEVYPVVANMAPVVEEELRDLLVQLSDAFVSCRVSKAGKVTDAKILGRLDERQAETLRAVVGAGEANARKLAEQSGDHVGVTAWNNRLAALASKGILTERRSGRLKFYAPVFKELRYGG